MGTSWTEQTVDAPSEALWGVWGAAPDDVWAVGGRGLPSSSGHAACTMTESTWEARALPTFTRPGRDRALQGLGPRGRRYVYAVGRFGTILHYDGATWAEQASGTSDDLIALWGTGPERDRRRRAGRSNARAVIWDGSGVELASPSSRCPGSTASI